MVKPWEVELAWEPELEDEGPIPPPDSEPAMVPVRRDLLQECLSYLPADLKDYLKAALNSQPRSEIVINPGNKYKHHATTGVGNNRPTSTAQPRTICFNCGDKCCNGIDCYYKDEAP